MGTNQSQASYGTVDVNPISEKRSEAKMNMPWFENVDFKRNTKKELIGKLNDADGLGNTAEYGSASGDLKNSLVEQDIKAKLLDKKKGTVSNKRESKKYRRSSEDEKKPNLFLILEKLLMQNIAKEFKSLRSQQQNDAPGLAWRRRAIALKQAPHLPWKRRSIDQHLPLKGKDLISGLSTKRQPNPIMAHLKQTRFFGDVASLEDRNKAKRQSPGISGRPRFTGDEKYVKGPNSGFGATRFLGDHESDPEGRPRFLGDSYESDQPECPFIVFSKPRFSGDQQTGPYTGPSKTRFFGDQPNTSSTRFF